MVSSINKLRLVVSIIFVFMLLIIVSTFVVVGIESEMDEEFYNKLSWVEMDQLNSIYSKYPTMVGLDMFYSMMGWLLYLVTGMLGILTYKLWTIKNI